MGLLTVAHAQSLAVIGLSSLPGGGAIPAAIAGRRAAAGVLVDFLLQLGLEFERLGVVLQGVAAGQHGLLASLGGLRGGSQAPACAPSITTVRAGLADSV
jgi:hypothetical protein